MSSLLFSHIINPVSKAENEELYKLQQFTFKSILNAKNYAFDYHVSVENLCVFTKGNSIDPPASFVNIGECQRSISDVILTKKNLPFIKEIIELLISHGKGEYLIYSNLDICLQPHFYVSAVEMIKQGHDAIIINRRVIDKRLADINNMNILYAEVGKEHTGYDCFIVKREVLQKFILKDICIGAPPVGNDLFLNVFAFAKNPILKTDLHLTFHLGTELLKNWGTKEIRAYNNRQFKELLREIAQNIKIENFPGSNKPFFIRHFKWLMNPTVKYPFILKIDIRNLTKKRRERQKKEIPGIKQRFLEWWIKYLKLD